MNKAASSAIDFLQRNQQTNENFKESFQSKSLAKSPTIGMPLSSKLTPSDENQIQKILADYYNPSRTKEEDVSRDYYKLKNLTEEIKSINVQSVLLHGERIQKAENLLKNYRDGAFSKWLMAAYGNRQTPYSMLRYYELYNDLQTEQLQKKLEAMPKKAAYTLAFRFGSRERKAKIVENFSGQKQRDLILEIQATFPSDVDDGRKPKSQNADAIFKMFELYRKVEKRRDELTHQHRERIRELIENLNKLLS